MMYHTLAAYYDALVSDDHSTALWVDYVKKNVRGKQILEVACGSGALAVALAQNGYEVCAGDISDDMLKQAMRKTNSDLVRWRCFDMRDLSQFTQVDAILCFCDSLNYLLEEADVHAFFTQAYAHLRDGGVLLFDMHSQDRLCEFANEYCEDGFIDDTAYEWTIVSEEDYLYQNFAFYDAQAHVTLEQHIQRIYDPEQIRKMLESIGFHVGICTDFDQPGIVAGEKYFYSCTK